MLKIMLAVSISEAAPVRYGHFFCHAIYLFVVSFFRVAKTFAGLKRIVRHSVSSKAR